MRILCGCQRKESKGEPPQEGALEVHLADRAKGGQDEKGWGREADSERIRTIILRKMMDTDKEIHFVGYGRFRNLLRS